ncbi:hypothetical protein GM418_01415 [Maribellus comscasis]|uniref:Outer membrane protein beta-barrel domain-containing protein n=1 Tax=Maribellus comscasis TaxID=2681766 RepID=A0A6I6JMG8_9BACT|nr:hypothetical protein [Maribellus comscasis]QGY42359.1 hypothetical protein GM418_01415 [Maribellus comscasis]
MKKVKTLGLLFLFLCVIFNSKAQELIPDRTIHPQNVGLYTGGHASTNGLGVNVGYVVNKRFTFRTGFETMKLNSNFDFDENDISYNADLHYKTGGIFLLADYFYTSRLYLTLGGLVNSFKPNMEGYAISDLEYGDIVIPAEEVGTFNFGAESGLKYSPYAGAGIRHFIGKKEKLVYSFELGMYYMGAPKLKIETTGLLLPTSDPAHGQAEYLENQFDAYKIYPVLKFNLAFKIF